ncbi:MAG TPA: hypothetical protein VF476_10310, partial [Chitinophagaceae bacterium]
MPSLFTKTAHTFSSIFLFCSTIFSQPGGPVSFSETFPFKHIEYFNSENGLNGNEVSAMAQDKNGFLRVMTDHALNRYDGYTFRSYSYDPRDSNSISTGWYFHLTEDKDGLLWLTNFYNGLFSFDTRTEKFTRHGYNHVYTMEIGPDGMIWVVTPNGLDRFDNKKRLYRNYLNLDSSRTPFDRIIEIVYDKHKSAGNTLWIINNKGIDGFNTTEGKL